MDTKTILITGANSGIGRASAAHFAANGHKLIIASRNVQRSRQVNREALNDHAAVFSLDMSSTESIRAFVAEISRSFQAIDVLINNAGTFSMKYKTNSGGVEKMLAVNYLGPFLLTHLLIPLLEENGNSRIINVSSDAYKYGKISVNTMLLKKIRSFPGYARSKMALNLFTLELSARMQERGIRVNAIHPGHIGTGIWDLFPNLEWLNELMKRLADRNGDTVEQAAHLIARVMKSEETGRYFTKNDDGTPLADLCSSDHATKLYDFTVSLLGVDPL